MELDNTLHCIVKHTALYHLAPQHHRENTFFNIFHAHIAQLTCMTCTSMAEVAIQQVVFGASAKGTEIDDATLVHIN